MTNIIIFMSNLFIFRTKPGMFRTNSVIFTVKKAEKWSINGHNLCNLDPANY